MNKAIIKGIFIHFHACVFKLQIFKKLLDIFLQFLGNVTIDVNGNVAFFKISLDFKLLLFKNSMSNFHQMTYALFI